jgi:hypothetical protein
MSPKVGFIVHGYDVYFRHSPINISEGAGVNSYAGDQDPE